MASARVWVPRSNAPTKSTPLSTVLALFVGLLAEIGFRVPSLTRVCGSPLFGIFFSAFSSTSTARGSFELFAFCPVAILFSKIIARLS
jgi:hypothetical protein